MQRFSLLEINLSIEILINPSSDRLLLKSPSRRIRPTTVALTLAGSTKSAKLCLNLQDGEAQQMERLTSKSLTSLLEFRPQEWVKAYKPLHSQGLMIEHSLQPSSEVESDGFTEHFLVLSFNHNLRQIHRFAGCEYDGANTPGDVFLVPANVPSFHHWEAEVADDGLVFYADPKLLQKVATENDCLNLDRIELRPILQARDPQIEAISTLFRTEMYNDELGGELYAESLANVFLLHLLRNYCTLPHTLRSDAKGGLSTPKLQQAIGYIQANLDQKLSLEAIAQQLNLSVYYFCELFTRSMGISPYKYVLQQRVERAKQLLKDKEKAISDVALECGFANQTHLNRHFRKFTDMTPKTYRNT
jgi:AraC family transcriptional regulator